MLTHEGFMVSVLFACKYKVSVIDLAPSQLEIFDDSALVDFICLSKILKRTATKLPQTLQLNMSKD